MGSFYIGCKVENHKDPKKVAVVPKLLVDTGSEFTWLPGEALTGIGVEPVKKDLQIQMANGEIVTRSVGYAILRTGKFFTADEVVFAQPGDPNLLGARAVHGMNVRVDMRRKKLVDAGPIVAANTVHFENKVRSPACKNATRGFSLAPRLQPGVSHRARIENRFNGFSPRAEAVETAGNFSARAFHRAEAAVLMGTDT